MRENTLRGAGPAAVNAQKTHCIRGHLFDESNTRIYRGRRSCKICARDACRINMRKRRARLKC